MRGLIILNPSSGMQKVQKVAWETAHKLLSDQTASIINVFYTRGKEEMPPRWPVPSVLENMILF